MLAASALIGAYVAQYGFELHPCELCYYQRYPYMAIVLVASLALVLRVNVAQTRIVMAVCAALFLVDAGIAVFHAGVELEWWQGLESCSGSPLTGLPAEEVLRKIMGAPSVSCKDPAFRFLGLSMAGWNVLYASAAALMSGWSFQKLGGQHE